MEQSSQLFVRRLMDEIRRLHHLPKVQVERIVGPILGLFLPEVLGALVEGVHGGEGFEVVSAEFPLKFSHNHQSTNVDWLVLHPRLGLVVLLELKTAPDSIDREQLDIYEDVRQRVEREGGSFLMEDLRRIREASSQRAKYDVLIEACSRHDGALAAARRAATVCLVPAGSTLPDTGAPRTVRHFRDLPMSIGGELAADWPVVREALCALDSLPAEARAPKNPADFALHVLENLRRQGERRKPTRFWIGNTGSGEAPNYQVEFSDGAVQTFHYRGAPHRVSSFDPSRLLGPFSFES